MWWTSLCTNLSHLCGCFLKISFQNCDCWGKRYKHFMILNSCLGFAFKYIYLKGMHDWRRLLSRNLRGSLQTLPSRTNLFHDYGNVCLCLLLSFKKKTQVVEIGFRANLSLSLIKSAFLMWQAENFKSLSGETCNEIGDGGTPDSESSLNRYVFPVHWGDWNS